MSTSAESATIVDPSVPASRVARRYADYLAERFPVIAHGVLILSFYSSNQFLAHVLTHAGEPMKYDVTSLLGYVTLFFFFLHLRVFDDHKDFEDDCRHFPDRTLQRGVVTLSHLKFLAAISLVVQLVCAALRGPAALVSVLGVIGFSVLMLKEFFARKLLKRHFLLSASTHMLIMPLLAMVVYSFATGRYFWQAPGWFWMYSLVGFFVAFNWEVSRKIRTPEQEIDGLESYTKIFGTYGAAYVVLLIRVIDTLLVSLVAWHLQMSVWFYAWIVGLFVVCLWGFVQYRFQTTPASAKRLSTYAGFYIVAFDLALAIELGSTHGVQIGGLS